MIITVWLLMLFFSWFWFFWFRKLSNITNDSNVLFALHKFNFQKEFLIETAFGRSLIKLGERLWDGNVVAGLYIDVPKDYVSTYYKEIYQILYLIQIFQILTQILVEICSGKAAKYCFKRFKRLLPTRTKLRLCPVAKLEHFVCF